MVIDYYKDWERKDWNDWMDRHKAAVRRNQVTPQWFKRLVDWINGLWPRWVRA
jgi:hypothetical protein